VLLDKLGPEPLSADFTGSDFAARLGDTAAKSSGAPGSKIHRRAGQHLRQ
jgi:hypothetical protein